VALRKKPRPADAEPAKKQQAEVVPPPAEPPPAVEHKPVLDLDSSALILCPKSPEDVIHNVIIRQLQDDLANPPQPIPENPALALLRRVQEAKDAGKPLAEYAQEAAKIFQGLDAEEKLTEAAIRHVRVRSISRQAAAEEYLDQFLDRCLKRGDLSPKEALVFRQQNAAGLIQNVKALLERLERGSGDTAAFNPEDMQRIDWTLQVVEKTSSHPFGQMTPLGREIVRKITMTARRKLYKANVKQ
jgi:hypothetical protein